MYTSSPWCCPRSSFVLFDGSCTSLPCLSRMLLHLFVLNDAPAPLYTDILVLHLWSRQCAYAPLVYVCVSFCVHVSMFLLWLSDSLNHRASHSPSPLPLTVRLEKLLSLSLSVSVSVCQSVFLSVCRFVCLSFCPSDSSTFLICLSFCLRHLSPSSLPEAVSTESQIRRPTCIEWKRLFGLALLFPPRSSTYLLHEGILHLC